MLTRKQTTPTPTSSPPIHFPWVAVFADGCQQSSLDPARWEGPPPQPGQLWWDRTCHDMATVIALHRL